MVDVTPLATYQSASHSGFSQSQQATLGTATYSYAIPSDGGYPWWAADYGTEQFAASVVIDKYGKDLSLSAAPSVICP